MIVSHLTTLATSRIATAVAGVGARRSVGGFVKLRLPTTTSISSSTTTSTTTTTATNLHLLPFPQRPPSRGFSTGPGNNGAGSHHHSYHHHHSNSSNNSNNGQHHRSSFSSMLATSPFSSSSRDGSDKNNKDPKSLRDPGLSLTSVISNPKEVTPPKGLPSRSEQIRRLMMMNRNDQKGQDQAAAAAATTTTTTEAPYDILVVGGGATGAGIALDAATRGLSTACIERGDFASETSSRSTKLIWAGIKYMATATSVLLSPKLLTNPIATVKDFFSEMKMVFHCHQERKFMMHRQRHLCNWIPIAIPFTTWHVSPPPFDHPLYGFFPLLAPPVLKFYDALSQFTCPPSYIMTPTKARQVFPQLEGSSLKYCAVFYEAQHNDARTNLAIALTAAEKGATIANYVEMIDAIKDDVDGKVIGIKALDRMTGQTFEIRAKKVVFAGGPFTDGLREMEEDADKMKPAVRGASGTHIVLPGYYCPNDMGLLDYNTSDGRFLFMLPWEGHTLVGTTDTLGPAETLPNPPEDEVEWLLKECSKYLSPAVEVRRSDVLSSWRGWRPLAADPHAPPDAPVSRDHVISENPETGVVFVAGGKWTTWREMAQDVVDRVVGSSGPKCTTLDVTLFGGGDGYTNTLSIELIQKYGMSQDVAEHLVKAYGARAWEVCEQIEPSRTKCSKFGKILVEGYPYIDADVVWACREYACTIEDVLSRRTRLAFLNKDAALAAIPVVADIMSKELGWTAKVKREQIKTAEKYVQGYGGRTPET